MPNPSTLIHVAKNPPASKGEKLTLTCDREHVLPFQITAAYASVTLDITLVTANTPPAIKAASVTPFGTIPVLTTRFGPIGRSNAILRYLAGLREDASLQGSPSIHAEAACDQWLEWGLSNLQPLLIVLSSIEGKAGSGVLHGFSEKDLTNARKVASAKIPVLLAQLDAHLSTRTFIASERITVADISIAASLVPYEGTLSHLPAEQLVNVKRWLATCLHQPHFVSVLSRGETSTASSTSGTKNTISAPKVRGAPEGSAATGWSAVVGTGVDTELPVSKFRRHRQRVCELLAYGEASIGQPVVVCGWARQCREGGAGKIYFLQINDGSCFDSIQCVCEDGKTEGFASLASAGATGASFKVEGELVKSPAKGQAVEVLVLKVTLLGGIEDPATYPLSAKKLKLETLRDIQHLRPRTNTLGAVTRVRNACAFATHKFFQERGFAYIHTPILTNSDCEGAGEMFQVTTVLPDAEHGKIADIPKTDKGMIDYKKDFFGKPAMLTVSGQLQVEAFAEALCDVYTFGPTFRAENSHTSRHLAEFWMIEPEIAFATLEEDMCLAEDYLKYCTQYVLDHCKSDLAFFEAQFEKGLVARLENVVQEPFQRLTYTDAVALLLKPEHQKKGNFVEKVFWGCDLASEHERYITEQVFKKPVIVTNYPKEIKAFYMKLDDDGRTVRAMDVLVPKIGEIIGGSQREDDLDKIKKRMKEMNVSEEPLWWYLDLRRYGSVPHAGFGLGFERLVMYVTGIENIRDSIPFPRYPGSCPI